MRKSWRSGATKKATVRPHIEGIKGLPTHKEWNLLVDLIQSGELKKVPV